MIFVFFMARSNMLWVEFMGFVEDFSANVNKYSYTGEHKNTFCH